MYLYPLNASAFFNFQLRHSILLVESLILYVREALTGARCFLNTTHLIISFVSAVTLRAHLSPWCVFYSPFWSSSLRPGFVFSIRVFLWAGGTGSDRGKLAICYTDRKMRWMQNELIPNVSTESSLILFFLWLWYISWGLLPYPKSLSWQLGLTTKYIDVGVVYPLDSIIYETKFWNSINILCFCPYGQHLVYI